MVQCFTKASFAHHYLSLCSVMMVVSKTTGLARVTVSLFSEGWLLEQMANRRDYEVVRPIRLHRRYSRDTEVTLHAELCLNNILWICYDTTTSIIKTHLRVQLHSFSDQTK